MAISRENKGRHLIVFLKEPRPGRVKTRLAKDIGSIAAAAWYRRQCKRLIRRVCFDERWNAVLAVSPDAECMDSRAWPSSLPRVPQGRGDLGTRMKRAFRLLPPGPAIIIGSDVPDITPVEVERAFRLLGDHQAVFGPSPDGGYWLVGFKRVCAMPRGAFKGVRWSSAHALADSGRSLKGLRIALTDELSDVDEAADLNSDSFVR